MYIWCYVGLNVRENAQNSEHYSDYLAGHSKYDTQ